MGSGKSYGGVGLTPDLPVSVLEKYLTPYRVPSFEAVAVTGKGVIESLRVGINTTLQRLERI